MTSLRNDELQSALVAYLKTKTAITNLLVTIDVPVGSKEIREDQWQGTEFDYPNIRVRMISSYPLGDGDQCCKTSFTVSIMAFSQDYSSWEADKIAGIISTQLHAKSFTQNSIYFSLRTTNLIPAVRSDIHTWRAECLIQGIACGIIEVENVWSPLYLSGLQAWYDVTLPLYTDVAKTTPAISQNDRVAVLPDSSGNGRDLIRVSDNTWRPVLRNNIYKSETLRTLRFTSGVHAMQTSATWIPFPSKRGSLYIAMFGGGGVAKLAIGMGNATGLWVYSNAYTNVKLYDTVDRNASNPDSKLGVQVHSLIRGADTTVTYYRDGVLDGNITIGNNQYDEGIFKLSNPAANGVHADICEIILLDHVSDATERSLIEAYLKSKWEDTIRVPVWTRAGNVVVADIPAEDSSVYEPTVLYEGDPQILAGPNVFKMWFSSGWDNPATISYAESADGISWTKYGSNPVLAQGSRSCIVKNGAVYWLYVKIDASGSISLYTSNDGLTWALDTADLLQPGAGGAWDSQRIDNIHVWQEGVGDWRLLYDGKKVGDLCYSLGYATSVDGKTWTKYAGNPVMVNGGGPCLRKIGSTFWLWQHHWIENDSDLPTDIFRYYSTDCINWVRNPAHVPSLSRLSADEGVGYLGYGQVADPWIMEVGGSCYLFYSASSNGGSKAGAMHIKLATAAMTLAQLVTTQEGA